MDRTKALAALQLLRPTQWIKAAFIFAPLFFALRWMDMHAWWLTILAAISFTASACVVYIFNDWVDMEHDKVHPKKRLRPLAAGTITEAQAARLGAGLLLLSFGIAWIWLPLACMHLLIAYLLLNMAYTLGFKKTSILDVVLLACFYILRVLMGCAAISVDASAWIILTTFFLALTIGFAKRWAEITILQHKPLKANLQGYDQAFIWCLLGICTAASLITYAIYAVEKQAEIGSTTLVYSVIFVAAGFFRFLHLALVQRVGGEPEKIIVQDKTLLLILLFWLLFTLWSLHL